MQRVVALLRKLLGIRSPSLYWIGYYEKVPKIAMDVYERKIKMYFYFVSYVYLEKKTHIFGYMRVDMGVPVTCIEHVHRMREQMEEVLEMKPIIILNYQLLESTPF